jgi:hypothetical protein
MNFQNYKYCNTVYFVWDRFQIKYSKKNGKGTIRCCFFFFWECGFAYDPSKARTSSGLCFCRRQIKARMIALGKKSLDQTLSLEQAIRRQKRLDALLADAEVSSLRGTGQRDCTVYKK